MACYTKKSEVVLNIVLIHCVFCNLALMQTNCSWQTQLANRKQILESVELASRSEIQHLTSKLERANDAICANELEVERLNMRVDDLTENNRMVLEDQQRLQEELRQSKKMLEVSGGTVRKMNREQCLGEAAGRLFIPELLSLSRAIVTFLIGLQAGFVLVWCSAVFPRVP